MIRQFLGDIAKWVKKHKAETILITFLLVLSATAHAWNMFNFPYLENDEATYSSRAWAVVTDGKLDVTTYRYDHAPLGWITIGLWYIVSGGTWLFDNLLVSGRVFMLIVHLASTLLVYVLAKRFSKDSKVAATCAVTLFAISPLSIYFNRRILLDNLMTFWLLLSTLLATQPQPRLKHYIGSGVTFGFAVLTKLNAIFVGPALLLIVLLRADKAHKKHAAVYWLAFSGFIVSMFFLYALLKGELFASPLNANGEPLRVSVADTFSLQLGRGDFAFPWQPESSFRQNLDSWILKDWFILALGSLSTLILTIIGFLRRKTEPLILPLTLFIWCFLAFLARGKLVIDLYIVPVIPYLAITVGVLAGLTYRKLSHVSVRVLMSVLLLGIVGTTYAGASNYRVFTQDETNNQLMAVDWVLKNIPKDAIIASDNYSYPLLAQKYGYTKVSYFFNTEYDPDVKASYDNDWRNIEYMIVTHELIQQMKAGTVPLMKEAFDHAELLADFRSNATSFIDLDKYISTNGDWAQVYRVKTNNQIVLQDSWEYFKSRFIVDYGQVVDLTNGELTTSSDQAKTMLRAVEQNDIDTFRGVWQWSKDHLQYRTTDKLLSWKWEKQSDGSYKLGDTNTVCDADQHVIYALSLGAAQWKQPAYLAEARTIAKDWWDQCVFERGGRLFIDSSADGSITQRLINPGYFAPEIYQYMQAQMPEFAWQKLIEDQYWLLNAVHDQVGFIPNWLLVQTNGIITSAEQVVPGGMAFGYDAMALIPNLTIAYREQNDTEARDLLEKIKTPLESLHASENNLATAAMLAISYETLGQAQSAQKLYDDVVYATYLPTEGKWSDGFNYRNHYWGWQFHRLQERQNSTDSAIKIR